MRTVINLSYSFIKAQGMNAGPGPQQGSLQIARIIEPRIHLETFRDVFR